MTSLAKIYGAPDSSRKHEKGSSGENRRKYVFDTYDRNTADGDIIVRCHMGRGRSLMMCVLGDNEEIVDVCGSRTEEEDQRSLYRSTVCMDGHIYARIEWQELKRRERINKERFASRHDAPFSIGRLPRPYRQMQGEGEYELRSQSRSNLYYGDASKLSRNPSSFVSASTRNASPVNSIRRQREGSTSVFSQGGRPRDNAGTLPYIRKASAASSVQLSPSRRANRSPRLILPAIK
ncbi:uncharacterized protein TM35_000541180 [Trypanosoma theileri]|uniref:Uncharacterized protein n=1 Tax=Trypanosoma theileri TaxID=67003 RepID=A0A1X0NGJ5_9TRYP|nr:uncharacterized protein TM35_000541180 [Trypanosoma theileri]ORC83894.1 hypothetical protein TM35_000541180 [Trypanosoma theileri]